MGSSPTIPTMDEQLAQDIAEARAYANKGPSVSRATVGRLVDALEETPHRPLWRDLLMAGVVALLAFGVILGAAWLGAFAGL